MQKILLICLLAIIVLFQYQLKDGTGGLESDLKIKQQIATQKKINSKLLQRNLILETKINSLKGSNDAIEARSRNEFNVIKPNEILVTFPGNELYPYKKNN